MVEQHPTKAELAIMQDNMMSWDDYCKKEFNQTYVEWLMSYKPLGHAIQDIIPEE